MKFKTGLVSLLVVCGACSQATKETDVVKDSFDFAGQQLKYAFTQIDSAKASMPEEQLKRKPVSPRTIEDNGALRLVASRDWTSGFFPGELWYMYEYTQDDFWKKQAQAFTANIEDQKTNGGTHDMGFKMYCSFGNGYRLTNDANYKNILLESAATLITRYKPTIGCIRSWDHSRDKWQCPVIIDNMMNLELLFWAARNGGERRLYDMACEHADTTMKYQFRKDYSCYHVAVYDTITGHFIKGVTHQGLSDNSMWARGQAWAIYGYTMVYRETGEVRFLNFARKVADAYLSRLPEDLIPYWDFDAPDLSSGEPKDASAAAITASALLELSTYVTERDSSHYYYDQAEKMLEMLSSSAYKAGDTKYAFLLHSVGHMPRGGEVDASIIYADYYYLEALIRFKRLQEKRSILANL